MSSDDDGRRRQIDELTKQTRLMSSLSVLYGQAVAERVGLHSTDMETLDLINVIGPMTAGQLAEATGLSTGAMTRLIDRLESGGYVHRRADPRDRRRVIVEPIPENNARVLSLFAPMGKRMAELWMTYTPDQLDIVADFVKKSNALMSQENLRLREGLPEKRPDASD